ncbi:MAG: DUF1186 domain-containing protein [Bacteroidota bacterium]|nr:DUF1186 domain-containing protein [Bacteroidota bacterium]
MIHNYDSMVLTRYKITSNPSELDNLFAITPEIKELIKSTFKKVVNKKKNADKDVLQLIEKYPHIPQFKNYLALFHSLKGNLDKAIEINHLILKEHPEYLYGKINMAITFLGSHQVSKIPELLGDAMEIKSLYPDREIFHVEEVMSFYEVAVDYFVETKDIEQAEIRLKIMKDIELDNPKTIESEKKIFVYHLKKKFKKINMNMKSLSAPDFIPKKKYKQTNIEPIFNNREITLLYQFGFDINIIKTILKLPRKSLIEDLEKVIIDGIERYKYFKKETEWKFYTHSFIFHALFMLRELEAEESLEVVLDLFRQNKKFLDYWFSDSLTQDLWMVIYELGKNQLNLLTDYIIEEGNFTYARSEVSVAVSQIGVNFPERRNEILEWYYFVFNYFIEQKDNDKLIDTDVIGLMLGDILDMKALELEETIIKLYELDIVHIGTVGELDDYLRDLHNKNYKVFKRKNFSLERVYKDFSEWEKSIERNSEKKYKEDNEVPQEKYTPLPEQYKGTGRNEKCPCGSGLKFKKCHGK